MPEPLVSVVTTAFNGERFLADAIESVLGQTWPSIEAIVVDDGSSDRSAEIAAGYPVRLIRQQNMGVARARNAGAEAATGELLAFLDQDDVYLPHKIERQAETLDAAPEAGLCVCSMEYVLEPGCEVPRWMDPQMVGLEIPTWQVGCLLVLRETFEAVGPFDPAFTWANDVDWFVRTRDAGFQTAVLDEALVRYRVHDENESGRTRGMMREQLQVFHASVRRKREAAQRG